MIPSNKKIERMIQVSRLYYEQDMTQNNIAQEMGISRPLVSQLLSEAKACGIVAIHINQVENREALLRHRLIQRYGLRSAIVVPDEGSTEDTDRAVAAATYKECFQEDSNYSHIGIGWGSIMGLMADYADTLTPRPHRHGVLSPLIGGISAPYRGYHTNEIIRVLSAKTGFDGEYLYAPAVFASQEELATARVMGPNQIPISLWDQLDLAIVNISNYPAYPDLDGSSRFGESLTQRHAVGRILAHYYSAEGDIIQPQQDTVLQASLGQLKSTKQVTAVCSSLLRPQCVDGALALGMIHTLILPVSMAQQLLDR